MRWTRHIARMGRGEVYAGFWWGNQLKRDHFEDSGVDVSTKLRWNFRKWDGGA